MIFSSDYGLKYETPVVIGKFWKNDKMKKLSINAEEEEEEEGEWAKVFAPELKHNENIYRK